MTVRSIGSRVLAAAAASALVGCFDPGDGVEPRLDELYFPTGLALSPGGSRLYVVNSDFDLQFNGGSLQAYDTDALQRFVPMYCESDADCPGGLICDDEPGEDGFAPSKWCVDPADPRPCGEITVPGFERPAIGDKSVAEQSLAPGRCNYVAAAPLLVDAVGIGAFATDVRLLEHPLNVDLPATARDADGSPIARLVVPVRGDATLHWIDVNDDRTAAPPFELDCGQRGNGECDENHRRGNASSEENTRGLSAPAEPFGIAATREGDAIVVTHQSDGAASLYVNDWGDGLANFGSGPALEFVLGGLPSGAVGVAAIPEPALIEEEPIDYQPGFLVTFRNAAEVRLLRYYDDAVAQPARPFIQSSGGVPITINSLGTDSRGIAIDSEPRELCEAECPEVSGEPRSSCLDDCAGIPLGVYVANRAPASLLVGRTRTNSSPTSSDDLPTFTESIPLEFGPSRVVVGKVRRSDGTSATRVFVLCFDARRIYVYDPEKHDVVKVIETGRGPHGLVIDEERALGYISHFTDSYIGVVDLNESHVNRYGTIVTSFGVRTSPRGTN